MFAGLIGGVADILLGEMGENLTIGMFFKQFRRNLRRN
jgi:hypothetical protein|tara:strand:+ start:9165 stop:9278 length:114 start_codon:yes stop_codon:yes gene_type:complete